MAKQETCHNCVYARWDLKLWARTLSSGFPAGPTCANQPDSPERWRDCPWGSVCRNFRARPRIPTGEAVETIPLGDGLVAYVDAADYQWLSQWTWHLYGDGYPARYEKHRKIFMHREIMQPPKGMIVDHADPNRANNCRFNLRVCTREENMRNNRKRRGSSSQYKGVGYSKRLRKFYARIWFEGENRHLGYHAEEAEAARAYDAGAVEMFGEFARLNFPQEWPAERRAEVYAQRAAAGKATGTRRKAKEAGRRTEAKENSARNARCKESPVRAMGHKAQPQRERTPARRHRDAGGTTATPRRKGAV